VGAGAVQWRVLAAAIELRPVEGSSVLGCVITDTSGELTALFYGRTHITGLRPGSNVKLRGTIGITSTGAVKINPAYELLDCAPVAYPALT
jgi:hypothetical protein